MCRVASSGAEKDGVGISEVDLSGIGMKWT